VPGRHSSLTASFRTRALTVSTNLVLSISVSERSLFGQPAALPLLQLTLRALWDRRDRNRITWEVYRKVGDPLTALKTSADDFYEALAPQTRPRRAASCLNSCTWTTCLKHIGSRSRNVGCCELARPTPRKCSTC
jgi:hypothetical protein